MADEPNRITIVVHQPGVWIWIIPFANGITSLGFVGNPEFFKRYEGIRRRNFARADRVATLFQLSVSTDVEFAFRAQGAGIMVGHYR
jgi:hypothetical protein